MKPTVSTLIIPAAGLGTRLRPITYVYPKELVRLVDKPVCFYLLAEAYLAGIRQVIFVIHEDNLMTSEFFNSPDAENLLAEFPGLEVSFVETDERNGDGQAVLEAERFLSGQNAFAVSMGDLVTLPGTSILKELVDAYAVNSTPIISVEEVAREKTNQYGIICGTKLDAMRYQVDSIVEKPKPEEAPSTLAMTGKYILTPDIFEDLKEFEELNEGELKLAHALNRFAKRSKLEALKCKTPHFDTGTKHSLLETELRFSLEHPELQEIAKRILGR